MSMGAVRGKVFGIGFQKTGTTSFHHYMRRLGFRSIHWPHVVEGVNYERLCIPALKHRETVVNVLQPVLDRFDAFSDVPFPALYRELYDTVPGSRFVLVERDCDQWWKSLMRHWRVAPSRPRRLDPYEYLLYNLYSEDEITHVSHHDEARVKDIYERHGESVRAFFEGRRGSLITVRLEDPDIGARICAFLGVENERPFPRITRRSSAGGAPSMGRW